MIVKLTTEQSVYIEIDGYTYYIDHSLDEPIVERWNDNKTTETITLLPKENDSDSEDWRGNFWGKRQEDNRLPNS